ncbi:MULTISPECIES: cation diffusion facilitator family transporter [Hymenobacter]|uniref:Cobalt-zinc-cadmium efflux system protein n=3 Tax=Hymenobacter TaxID=89966 RepID=A0A1M6M9K9_9BACT|nr:MULTISPECIES: cation diffusion facilitator family transporter [Hymenobacter]MBD2717205.1 cation transporter [Hymenobacter duratus]MBR7952124.1 cation transporter [Microvirga sp. STR05]SDY92647.1 cobalt-zinc-cadmium efflux system protein [Hymenobacter psychrophilus]SHJ80152.1 cobalt-zinc-cadmium efflux system protein [Hymenobacter daecheongensis DSM 21074]
MSGSHGMSGSAASRNKRALTIVFFTTLAYLVAEVIGGWWTGSLALLADAGHMLTDVAGVGLALLAIRFGEKPATPERTYGYYRFEILAALTNAVVLILISLYILYEAYFRFLNPPKVESTTMMWVAGVGMLVNLYGVYLLRKSSGESLNMKGAYFEVLSDLLTSVGVIIAGAIMLTTKWYYADPLLSAGIGLFILPRTWALLKESVAVLLEGTPADVNLEALRQGLLAEPGVAAVHDLHAWVLTSGVNALSVHVVLAEGAQHDDVLARAHAYVTGKHAVQHATIQVERGDFARHETHL